jgi:hypothetical protein
MRLKLWCFPQAESQFRNAILTNYYQRKPGVCGQFFHFELDHEQTQALVNMFTPLPSPYNTLTPPIAAPVHEHVKNPHCHLYVQDSLRVTVMSNQKRL